jgi:ribosomal 50S subunit-recycling heat shock protein
MDQGAKLLRALGVRAMQKRVLAIEFLSHGLHEIEIDRAKPPDELAVGEIIPVQVENLVVQEEIHSVRPLNEACRMTE